MPFYVGVSGLHGLGARQGLPGHDRARSTTPGQSCGDVGFTVYAASYGFSGLLWIMAVVRDPSWPAARGFSEQTKSSHDGETVGGSGRVQHAIHVQGRRYGHSFTEKSHVCSLVS